MDWEQLKAQLDGAVRQEAIKVLDEAIGRLQQLRSDYLARSGSVDPPMQVPTSSEATAEPELRTYTPKQLTPRNCKVCGTEFTPTHHLQKTCPEHRTKKADFGMRKVGTDIGLTDEEREWKEYGESVASKLAKRSDAVVLPRSA